VISIPDPDVVFTDVGLAALGGFFAWRLARDSRPGMLVMAGLASAAFWGAAFHAFFPHKTTTTAGFVIWLLVAFSIAVVAESLLDMALGVLLARRTPGDSPGNPKTRRVIVLLYCVLFAVVVLFIDESFSTIAGLYAPVLVLALSAALYKALRTGNPTWTLISSGLALSMLAGLLQQTGVAIHPTYFDHNAVYHVVQGAALVLLYLGFRARRADSPARA
jgi:hypothetical protein